MINWLKRKMNSTPRIIFGGFLTTIFISSLVLMLPVCSADGCWTGYIDALCTATASVCVTGLVTVSTFSHWSMFGKTVILGLIQLGGLGVICIAIGFLLLLKKRISISSRKVIQESYNLDTSQGMVILVLRILKTTFFIEILGAIGLSIRFIPQYGWSKGIVFSIFHSVSAFCNAGMDILGETSLISYAGDVYFNVVIMLLVVSGGLGFIVWWEIIDLIKLWWEKKYGLSKLWERMTLHCKIVLSMTFLLLLAGFVIVFVLESDNTKTLGNMSLGEKILASIFQSVTIRTAGFYTIVQENFKISTNMLMCIFMLIGGSPVGTAGGIKTTTVAILLVEVISVVKGKDNAELYKRRIDKDNVRTAMAVTSISIVAIVMAMILLSETESASMKVIMYEVFSAVGTTGISMGLTSELSMIGKVVIIFLMFMGRIGPITMATAIATKRIKTKDAKLPERRIIVG